MAYIVTRDGEEWSIAALRTSLKKNLPDYMIPSVFVFLDELPLTPNGKIDRKSLPVPEMGRTQLEQVYVAPRTPTEQVLCSLYAQVLDLEWVGVHDNFFELGGDSIISIQVVAYARQYGIHLTPKDIFQHQTVAQLALVSKTSKMIVAEQGLVSGVVSLTPIQQWFFDKGPSDKFSLD